MLEGIDVAHGSEEQVTGAHPRVYIVFLSHASQDSAIALSVCEALERAGMTCWIAPRDVTPGAFYADEIVHAIDTARAIVLILSENAAASPHVLREVERAVSKRHPVISLRIDQAPLPVGLEYFLNTSHWLDASKCEIASVIQKLVAAVRRAIETPTITVVSATETVAARTPYPSRAGHTVRRVAIVAGCLMAVAIAGFAAFSSWEATHRATVATAVPATVSAQSPIPEKSVAVLPFVDMSEKKDQEYFSDGLSEELIDMLTKVPDLRVPARTSSFYFKGKQATIGDIAKALGVAYVLEGSVRKSGKTMRITAQLIKTDAGFHVWSETYDRPLDDVFKLQDEIAEAVVSALKMSLIPRAAVASNNARNIEANDLYLQALFLTNHQLTAETSKRSVELLSRALVLDPGFALAWAELSRMKGFLAGQGLLPPGELETARKEARGAAEKAVALDPLLPEAHNALGVVDLREDEITKATSEFRRALELNPRSSDAILQLGSIAGEEGRLDEQVRLKEQALAIDPLNINILDRLGFAYLAVGKPAAAETIFRRQLELSPQNMFAKTNLGVALALQGKPAEALDFLERGANDDSERRWARALLYPALGRRTEADALLVSLERDPGSAQPFDIAEVYAYHNDKDRAFDWLERQYRVDPKYLRGEIHSEPLLANLRGDPRFKALLRKLKLPE
jgi:TolB-like protein/Flp pilus assembly protein TadD